MAKKTNGWQIVTFVLIGVLVLGLITGFIVFKGDGTPNGNVYNSCVDLGGRCSVKCYSHEEMATGGNLGCPTNQFCCMPEEKRCEGMGGTWVSFHNCCCPAEFSESQYLTNPDNYLKLYPDHTCCVIE